MLDDQYLISFEILRRLTLGNYVPMENPDTFMPIRIVNERQNDIRWIKRAWGNIQLNDLKIEGISAGDGQ